jgi:hypothetical protein
VKKAAYMKFKHPASGFALYFDELMKLPELEVIGRMAPRGVLVRVAPEMLGRGFEVASRLRDAGYAVEMDFPGKRPGDFRWLVETGASVAAHR